MRIVTFSPFQKETSAEAMPHFGTLLNNVIVDLSEIAAEQSVSIPNNSLDFLYAGETVWNTARDLLASARQNIAALRQSGLVFDMDQVEFLPPIQRPGKIICVGQNYTKHIMEMGREIPKYPVLFAKYPNVLRGHNQTIPMPTVSTMLDWEGELAFVIGKRAKDVKADDYAQYIFGYAPFNDVTVRDYQRRTSQFLPGKTFDGTGPFGPAIVTPDEISDPQALDLKVRLNGELMQEGNTSDLFFKIPFLVEHLSEIMTLEPGDIVSTGTPDGVGFARNPQIFMKPGDTVEVEIAELGILRNTVQ
jgi:acylpyruvate hydrolase